MKIVLAITGASGALYAKQFLDFFKLNSEHQLWVVASKNAQRIFNEELGLVLEQYWPNLFQNNTFDVPFVSGSARIDAGVILPASMGTIGRIANGVSDDTITRMGDVFLKERRPLILVPREMPYSLIHLKNLTTLAQAGATVLPASPAFYAGAKTLVDLANTVVARVLDQLKIPNNLMVRWQSS